MPPAELGIDLGGIWRRTMGVLTGRLRGADLEELDVGGPLFFSAVLGASHLVVNPPPPPPFPLPRAQRDMFVMLIVV